MGFGRKLGFKEKVIFSKNKSLFFGRFGGLTAGKLRVTLPFFKIQSDPFDKLSVTLSFVKV